MLEFVNSKTGLAVEPPEEPEPEQKGAVKPLSDRSFDGVVMDTTKDVLVKFYAPWCGHCKAIAPAYEELAVHMQKEYPDDLVIAEMDTTKFSKTGKKFQVQGFPTLKWFPKGNKAGEEYNGGRDFESLKQWILNARKPSKGDAKADSEVKTGEEEATKEAGDDQDDGVIELSNSNFDSLVLEAQTDVFVRFCSPYVGACLALDSEWESLANAVETEFGSQVMIADLDVVAHKATGNRFSVTSTPALLYFSQRDKANPIVYSVSQRTVDAMLAFVRKLVQETSS